METGIRALDELNHMRVGGFTLAVSDFAPSRFANQREFILRLRRGNIQSESPIFRGTYSAPVKALNLSGWIDGEFIEQARLGKAHLELWNKGCDGGLALSVMKALGETIPAGGRMWLAYERYGDEGVSVLETRRGLSAQVPPLATPIGLLLWAADCWLGVRDWHFPEGGREGPRKLQGNKALNTEHKHLRAAEAISDLRSFVRRRSTDDLVNRAQSRARMILRALEKIR
jgi:hypothetical protein